MRIKRNFRAFIKASGKRGTRKLTRVRWGDQRANPILRLWKKCREVEAALSRPVPKYRHD